MILSDMNIRIAVVQFEIAPLDRAKNLKRIEAFVQRAAKKQAQVVVFPEDCVTGSIFGDVSRLDAVQANRTAFQELAKKYTIDIVTGSSMEKQADGNFNTSYYVNREGEVLGTYRKNHLYPSERAFLSPGTEAPVFQTTYGKAAIVICWDMLFPEIFARLKTQGVEVIYCPSYWSREIAESMATHNSRSEEQLLDALSLTRAVETNAALVYCNAAGIIINVNHSKDTLIGHSQIVLPVLGAVRKLSHHREKMFIQEIDTDLLHGSHSIYHA